MDTSSIGHEATFAEKESPIVAARVGRGDSDSRRLIAVMSVALALGLSLALLNSSLPLARNALDYAKSSLYVVENHFDLYAVVGESGSAGGKPILFSVLAAPFVWLSNARIGIIAASSLGTSFFLWTITAALRRLSRQSSLLRGREPLALILATANPLVIYQFWSGYPDSLFAGLVVLAFVLTDIIANEPDRDTRKHIVVLGVTVLAAIHTKLYGAILCITCPLYWLSHALAKSRGTGPTASKVILFGVVFGAIGLLLIAAKLSMYPFLVLGTNSGFNDYLAGFASTSLHNLASGVLIIIVTLGVSFHVALSLVCKRGLSSQWAIAPATFVGIYVIGLLPASGISYNMRYLLPIFPFVSATLAAGAGLFATSAKKLILTLYGIIALFLVANFNIPRIEEAFNPSLSRNFPGFSESEGLLDNLRLPVQIALKRQIDTINSKVPDGSILYWSSDYYGTATHGLAHHLGIKNSLDVRYVLEPSDPSFSTRSVYLTEFTSYEPSETLWRTPSWATTQALGYGLFRLDPIRIELRSVSADPLPERQPILIRADLHSGIGIKLGAISFADNGGAIVTRSQQPFEFWISQPTVGRHEIRAQASYGQHELTNADPLVIYVGIPAFERVAGSADSLLMEGRSGEVAGAQNVLWLASSQYSAGFRFTNITVRRGAPIARAFLILSASGRTSGTTTFDITAELSPNADPFALSDRDLSRRHHTQSHVTWTLEPWTDAGQQSRSPNLARLLQEVTSQSAWQSGYAVVLFIHVSGEEREPWATDENGHEAPRLYVELTR